MTTLQQGGNVSLQQVAPSAGRVTLVIRWTPPAIGGNSVDASAFLLGANGKVIGDDYFVFYNQPRSADGSVVASSEIGSMRFAVDLGQVAAAVERIAFVATIHGRATVRGPVLDRRSPR